MVFQKAILKKISTTNTKRPSTPQIIFENPLDQDIFINGIELLPEAEFSQKGRLLILVNEVPVFNEDDSNQFFGYSKFPIPLGKILRRSNDIQVFAWNGTDSNTIKVQVNFSLSEVLQPFNAQAETLERSSFNAIVSEGVSIFPTKARLIGSEITLIDLQGYKKIIITLTKNSSILPTIISSDWGTSANIVDGDVLTISANQATTGEIDEVIVDFGSIATRNIKLKLKISINTAGDTVEFKTFISDDGIGFNLVDTRTESAIQIEVDKFFDIGSETFKFVKFTQQRIAGTGTPQNAIYELYDSNEIGGTASLSFEVKDVNEGLWSEFIAASEFGTISTGAAIVSQVGDVNTISISGKTYALPSTQTNFRAKYTITNDGFKNGVSMIKVG